MSTFAEAVLCAPSLEDDGKGGVVGRETGNVICPFATTAWSLEIPVNFVLCPISRIIPDYPRLSPIIRISRSSSLLSPAATMYGLVGTAI